MEMFIAIGIMFMIFGLIFLFTSLFAKEKLAVYGLVLALIGSTGLFFGLWQRQAGYSVSFDIGTYDVLAVDSNNTHLTRILAIKKNNPMRFGPRLYHIKNEYVHCNPVPRTINVVKTESGLEISPEFINNGR